MTLFKQINTQNLFGLGNALLAMLQQNKHSRKAQESTLLAPQAISSKKLSLFFFPALLIIIYPKNKHVREDMFVFSVTRGGKTNTFYTKSGKLQTLFKLPIP